MSAESFATMPGKKLDTVEFTICPPNTVEVKGTITLPNPVSVLGPYLESLHKAALDSNLKEVVLDLRPLSFVNSSAIRLFIDWTMWLRSVPAPSRYKLIMNGDRQVTWQRTALSALDNLAKGIIEVRYGA